MYDDPNPVEVPDKIINRMPWSMLYVLASGDKSMDYDLSITKISARVFRKLVLGPRCQANGGEAMRRARRYLALDPIDLKRHQVKHCADLIEYYGAHNAAVDVSVMGAGKTYTTVYVCKILDLRLMVICPNNASMLKWKKVAKQAGVEVECIMTYNRLSGSKARGTKNDYLRMSSRDPVEYATAPHMERVVDAGVLLVLDEFHFAKNRSSMRSRASVALCAGITLRPPSKSRVLLLSSTPIDREEHVVPILRMCGIVHSSPMCYQDMATNSYETPGIREITEWVGNIDREDRRWCDNACKDTKENVVWKLYAKYVVPVLVRKMDYEYTAECANGYYEADAASKQLVSTGVCKLKVFYRNLTTGRGVDMGSMVLGMKMIEEGKYPVAIRLARSYLESDPLGKVVLCFGYRQNLTGAMEDLREYGTVGIFGGIRGGVRIDAARRFRADPAVRVVVINPSVAGVSIDLDDKKGDSKRLMLVIPSNRFTDLVQCMGRVTRCDSRSVPIVRFLYLDDCNSESEILAKIIKKSMVMGSGRGRHPDALDLDVEMDMPMPGSFPSIQECEEEWLSS